MSFSTWTLYSRGSGRGGGGRGSGVKGESGSAVELGGG